MPSDETRHVLRAFGVAVTTYEDALQGGASPEAMTAAAAELELRLREVTALIDRLRRTASISRA